MKIVTGGPKTWEQKVNFVDANNVVLGWDTDQCCCESHGYFITGNNPTNTKLPTEEPPWPSDAELEPYVFDPAAIIENPLDDPDVDGGGSRAFTLRNGEATLFLVIYNFHNGYYSHGFTVDVGGKRIIDDSL